MIWTKLTNLPNEQLRLSPTSAIVFWQIVDGCVLHQGRKIRKADCNSFEVLDGHSFIARDRNFVFFAWNTVNEEIDRSSFQQLGHGYFVDSKLVYYEYETSLKPLKGATNRGFQIVGNGYARDAEYGYYFGRVIKKCERPTALRQIDQSKFISDSSRSSAECMVTDGERVFYESAELKGADPEAWQEIGRGFSMDANSVFFGSKKLGGATPDNWRMIKHPFSTNGVKVYEMGWALENADLATFEILPDGSCRDQYSTFSGKKRTT